ncbi:MAG: GNAT family N-acetyltransferase [Thermoguttaceae bacterium]|nr:GNAT family N-acetyltransferase [Thermoguttaceae bacterium]MDW8078310.1 GNAT family N-acetyltransferase [Thermoguttaceae bacterium]
MSVTYFKRYRMEADLHDLPLHWPQVPAGYRLLPWCQELLDLHAEVKYLSFRHELDAQLFPCFTDLAACRRLMRDIASREGFLPDATWLAVCYRGPDWLLEPCGTIQAVVDSCGEGWIQNVGVVPQHRRRGIGTCLLRHCLAGCARAGLKRVHLEVTADNLPAVALYQRVGFSVARTIFKPVEVAWR